ncbi:NYN domain-containing protein [Streptococcus salivarius]|uniref:NYN domain-containing protein n=1 Tax=Streptococcus salivarius TaxID=1304 RepID=UPI002C013D7E|nr:NYN domain-containing protein [Streptococcus salivarius]MEB3645209.1 NYN domain-containing protein [Streptococcus salivarius]
MDLLLIDNSNIFIEVKNIVGQDGRFDYDKFVKNYTNFKNQKKILVGSTPPKSDGFWSTMKSKGFDVYTYERKLNGEKAVDSKIIAKGVSFIVQQNHPATVNILSGDFDMFPLIEEALEKNWRVNLWSWKDSLSNKYLGVKEITIKYLDDVAEDLIYFTRDIDGYYEKEYFKERKIRLAREKKERELNQVKQNANNQISRLCYIDKNIYLEQINKLVDFEQISEIKRIVSVAKSKDLNLKNEAIKKENEQKRLDKEAKRQARKESLKQNWGWIATGVATFAGVITYAIKKTKN